VSPITFASIRPTQNTSEGGGGADEIVEDDDDWDSYSMYSAEDGRKPGGMLSFDAPLSDTAPGAHRHTLLMFSTGQVMEDDFTLAWYELGNHELLELHPPYTIVRLPRTRIMEYIQPYFECRVRALRAIAPNSGGGGVIGSGAGVEADVKGKRREEPRSPGPPVMGKRRKKTKMEWKERWLVIHCGQLHIYKHRADPQLAHACSLDLLAHLARVEDVLGLNFSKPHGICMKFRASTQQYQSLEPLPQVPKSPTTYGEWTDPWTGATIEREEATSPRPGEARERTASAGRRASVIDEAVENKPGGSFWYDSDGDGTWLIIDALENAGMCLSTLV